LDCDFSCPILKIIIELSLSKFKNQEIMMINKVKLRIYSQLHRNPTNYVKNNALRICDATLEIDYLSSQKKCAVKIIRKWIEDVKDPWQWNGIPRINETKIILEYLTVLYSVLD
jgi:hypothetical protein